MNISYLKITASSVLALTLLTGCGVTKSETAVKPAEHKGGFLGLSKNDDVKISGEKAIKGETNVVIPKFRIAFYTENNPGGYKSSSGHSIVINSTLQNVDAALLQKITDNSYNTFVKQLEEKGYKVLPKSELSKSETYNKFKITETQTKEEALFGPDAIFVSPSNMKTSDAKIYKGVENQDLLKEFEKSLVEVTLYVSYLSQEVETTLMIASGLTVGQVPLVTPGSNLVFYGYEASKCVGFCPDTFANISLGQPVYTNEIMGELKDVTGASDKVGDAISMLGSWMTSGLKVKNSKRYELIADPQKYENAITKVINQTTQKMVNTLAAHK